jgi:nucleoside phosphorylase
MNSYGAALACEKSKVPLLVLKIRSDAADEAASEDFKRFIAQYQGDLGREVRAWIQSLPLSPDSPQAYDEIQRLLK